MLFAFAVALHSQTTPPSLKSSIQKPIDAWTKSTTDAQRKDGDVAYTHKNGGLVVTHKYSRRDGAKSLKMRLADFDALPVSSDTFKMAWKSHETTMHLVIRSIDKRLFGTYCAEGKTGITLGTTYYPGALTKVASEDIMAFYKTH